ncbi:TROVE domain containing protein, putative [Angomonas deanei]|uniref:TROVE domain containing protein, putative n=1 Tax=Angomonas deanei TaxID=59799 RepID=A0A7G2C7L3_9TRYP|nr:TROVE domain containing protein, putative [Angomonas deanei]
MSYYKVPAADVTPLKDEIIDLVSLCLIKEPPFAPVKTGQDEVAPVQVEAPVDAPSDHTSSNGSVEESEASGAPPVKEEEDKKGTEVNEMIQKIRRLVHTISLQDGEFVLKLSLYLRLELNIRQMPNYLVALCAREKNCVPFLTPYLEKIVQLPSDWLSIANFAYYYDSDAAHVFDNGENSDDKGKVVAFAKADTKPNAAAELRIPSGLRQALVSRFEKFDEFSLAKYNNENSEKRKRQKRKNCHQGDWVPRNLNNNKKTFTYKQLVRMLHITKPAYSVCCLLGKRYPPSLEEFKTMGLHESPDGRRREFDPSKCGTRMRLAIPETWETRLAKDGNKGAVWDDLFANNRVPFMAMLRNLRNIVLHQCSVETYTQVIRRLSSEEEVANSKQFPYRFYTAREVVSEAEIHLLDVQNEVPKETHRTRSQYTIHPPVSPSFGTG